MISKVSNICLVLLTLFLACCKNQETTNSNTSTQNGISESKTSTVQKLLLDSLVKFEGKKLQADGLLDQFGINDRIKVLLGKDISYFNEGWGVESTLKKDIDVMYATACKKDNCNTLKLLLVLDILTNNINIYVFDNGRVRTFEESIIIGLSDQVSVEYERLRDDQMAGK